MARLTGHTYAFLVLSPSEPFLNTRIAIVSRLIEGSRFSGGSTTWNIVRPSGRFEDDNPPNHKESGTRTEWYHSGWSERVCFFSILQYFPKLSFFVTMDTRDPFCESLASRICMNLQPRQASCGREASSSSS